MMHAMLEAMNKDPSVRRRTRFADTVFLIATGDERWRFAFRRGAVSTASEADIVAVEVRIDADAWLAFQQPVPPPGCHDLYAMAESGRAQVTGDFLALFRYSYVLKDVVQQLATRKMFG